MKSDERQEIVAKIESLNAAIESARIELMLLASPERRGELEEELAQIRAEITAVKMETAERAPKRSFLGAYVVATLCLLTIYLVSTCK